MENYTIYDEIGRGTHSFVYKARRKRSIEYVAVKSTAKSRMDKILNEVQILHKLDSRYVLKFFNWYESQNHIWLIFEYCIGGDLLNLITQDKQLPESVVKAFGWELVAGLEYLHSNGILFCDLKPANVLIDECGSLKLADFGLARRIPTADTAVGAKALAPGSPNYMAPELFQPPAIHSFASDFWALGCVLYELFTGRPPFTHTTFSELARIIQTEPVPPPPAKSEMSPELADLLSQLLHKDPYQRIAWSNLVDHPFWIGCAGISSVPFPPQELFEAARPPSDELQADSLSVALSEHVPASGHPPSRSVDIGNESNNVSPRSNSSQTEGDDRDTRQDVGIPVSSDGMGDSDNGSEDKEFDDKAHGNGHHRPLTAPVPSVASMRTGKDSISKNRTEAPNIPQTKIIERATKTAPPARTNERTAPKTVAHRSKTSSTMKKASRLLFAAADCNVKPIAFCDDIEAVRAPKVRSDMLEFDAISADQLSACSTEDLEEHLKNIYISLKSLDASIAEKKSVLAHLFSLCLQPKLANVIVNSSLLTLLIKLLHQAYPDDVDIRQSSPIGALVPRITLVLGVLFRFATFISQTSPEQIESLTRRLSAIVNSSTTSVQNPSVVQAASTHSKRRAVACLGELLFYMATQKDCRVPSTGLACLLNALGDDDTVTKQYAIRTITNMLTHCNGREVLHEIVNESVMMALLRTLLLCDSKTDEVILLQTTTTQAIAQIFRHVRFSTSTFRASTKTKGSMLVLLSKPSILTSLWRGVEPADVSIDLAVSSLNVLNSYLEIQVDRARDEDTAVIVESHKDLLLSQIVDLSVIEAALGVRSRFEDDTRRPTKGPAHVNGSQKSETGRRYAEDDAARPSLLRAKALLFVYFGMLRSHKFAQSCIRERLVDAMERVLSMYSASIRTVRSSALTDTSSGDIIARQPAPLDQYVVHCGVNVIRLTIRTALKMSAECIASNGDINYADYGGRNQVVAAEPFQLFEQIVRNPTWRSQLCAFFLANEGKEFAFFIRLMSRLLTSFSTEMLVPMSKTVGASISELLLRLFHDSASDATALIGSEAGEIFSHLLPAVVVQLQQISSAHDESDSDIEDNQSANCIRIVYLVIIHLHQDLSEIDAERRSHFIRADLFSCFLLLFGSTGCDDSVWRYSIELLYGIVTREPELVKDLKTRGLVGPIISLLSAHKDGRHRPLPSSATWLVRTVVEASRQEDNLRSLHSFQLGKHLMGGLNYTASSGGNAAAMLDLLEVLYHLLYSRYEELRKTSGVKALEDFDGLVTVGHLLLRLCASNNSDQPQDSPQQSPSAKEESTNEDIADVASRCLVYLSQIFGYKLNEVLFQDPVSSKRPATSPNEAVATLVVSCLERSQCNGAATLRVLLTLKNCLRCDTSSRHNGKPSAASAGRWLAENLNVLSAIKRFAKGKRDPADAGTAREQISKTATEIVRISEVNVVPER